MSKRNHCVTILLHTLWLQSANRALLSTSDSVRMSDIHEILKKHQVLLSMVEHENPARQKILEGLLHRQQLVEIENLLPKLSPHEIATVIKTLRFEDGFRIWHKVPEDKLHETLWELPSEMSEKIDNQLDDGMPDSQINGFELIDGKLQQFQILTKHDLDGKKPIWIDMLKSTPVERKLLGKVFGVDLPDPEDETDLEVNSRFHIEDNDDIHLHSNFLLRKDGQSSTIPVTFVYHEGLLLSMRSEEVPAFRLQRLRARTRKGYVNDNFDLLLNLLGADVEYCADSLEDIYRTLREIGREVLDDSISDQEAAEILTQIADSEDLNGQIRGNLLDTERGLTFLIQCKVLSHDQLIDAQQGIRNASSLNNHTAFLFEKINFLMDSTIGFININQNRRINQLTFFGVVFMPLNIIAGIGGMSEFSMMTEGIPWQMSYGAFIVGMAILGWCTFTALKFFENRKIRHEAKRRLVRRAAH